MKDTRQPSSCYRSDGLHKNGYDSRAQARKAARSAQADVGRLGVYRGDCGKYHLGHGWFDR